MACRIEQLIRTALAVVLSGLMAACAEAASEPSVDERLRTAFARGDGFGAELVLREQLADGTPRAELAAAMGEAELMQGELAEARRWLAPGEFSPDTRGHGFRQLGRLEMRDGNLPAAGAAFDQAYRAIPDDPDLWVDIGRLRFRGGEQAQAVQAARKAVALGPRNPAALRFRGQLVRDAHGVRAALPWFEAALESHPDDLGLLLDYAATLGEAGRPTDMLRVVRKVARLDPANREVFFLQAVIAARAGETVLARSLLTRSGNVERGLPAALLLSGVIDLRSGNYASASQTFDSLLSDQPDNARVARLLARSLSLAGSHRELVARFGDEGAGSRCSPYIDQLVARSLEKLGERGEAAAYLDRAGRSQSAALTALRERTEVEVADARGGERGDNALALVRGFVGRGQADRAVSEARRFLARNPGSADAMGLLGDACLAAQRVNCALETYREAADIRRPWPLTMRMLAALEANGDGHAMTDLLERQLLGEPANARVAERLAQVRAAKGQWEKAIPLIDHALLHGSSRDPASLVLRARAALALGDAKSAREAAKRAYWLMPQDGAAIALLAETSDDAARGALSAKARRLREAAPETR